MDANGQWYDVTVYPAAQWTELLLWVLITLKQAQITDLLLLDYYGDTFFKSAGTTCVISYLP